MINNAINSGLPTAVNKGGTAATNAADARTNLGIIAANIPITDSGGYYSTKNVEAALQQLGTGGQIISGLTQYGSVYASGVNSITSTGILGANQIVIGTGTVPSLKTLTNTASISWDTTSGLTATILPAGVDHNSLANLTTGDPHTQYLTTGRALTWLKTRSTQDLPESSSFLYYTDTRARTSISVTALGLDYNNSTGVISLDSLYTIPTTARTNIWQHASDVRVETWAAPFSYDIGIHQASLNYDSATLGINESNQLYSKVAGMTAIFADNPLSGLGTSGSHLIISQAGDSSDGYLNATDWNIFNNKEPALGNPTYDGYILSSSALGVRTWIAEPSTMVYPSAGIAVSTGTAWDTSIATDYFVHDLSAFTTDNLTQGSTNLYDQVVSLTEGTGIGISGTYPSFTISNTTPGTPPAGSDTQVQYNDGGTAFGASPNLTFDGETLSTTQILIPPGYGYGLSCSPLNFNGIDYVADMGSGLGTIFFNNDPNPNFITLANAPLLIRAIDGTADVNIGLITTDFGQGPAHLTVYTLFDLATLTYLVNNSLPSGSTLDAFFDNGVTTAGGLAQNGAGAAYTWNLPSGTTVVTGYNPTTLTDTIPLPSPFSVTGGVTSMNSPVLYGTMVDGGPGSSNYAGIQLTGRILGNKTGALDTSQGGSNRAATFSASPVMANDLNWQLPSADGSAGQAWVTDSHGNLGWSSFLTTETDPLSLHLDQSTPQEINGGTPNFNSGLNVNSGININGASQLTDSQLLTFQHGSGTDGLIQSSDQLINWQQNGWDGTGWGIGAWEIVTAKENFSPNHHGSELGFWTTPIGGSTPEQALTLDENQNVIVFKNISFQPTGDKYINFSVPTNNNGANLHVEAGDAGVPTSARDGWGGAALSIRGGNGSAGFDDGVGTPQNGGVGGNLNIQGGNGGSGVNGGTAGANGSVIFNGNILFNSGFDVNGNINLTDGSVQNYRHGSGAGDVIVTGNQLINSQQTGWDGTDWGSGAREIVTAMEDFSPGHHGSKYTINVTPIGGNTPETALTVNPDQTIQFNQYTTDGLATFTGSDGTIASTLPSSINLSTFNNDLGQLPIFSTNGFVKFIDSNGTLAVDTNVYVQGTLDTDNTLAADSDSRVSSQKAIKAYINNTITYGISWQLPVADATLSTPPGSPTLNSRYVVAPTGLGAWATHDNEIATWNGASWDFVTPTAGWTVYSNADMDTYQFDGSVWFNIFTLSLGANASLSNLSGVAINTSLLPAVNNSVDLGSPSYGWKDIHITGTATLTGMSSVGFVKNNASGVLSGGNSVSSGDVTGGLGYTPEYQLTFSSPLSRSTNTISIPAATASVDGYLNHTDWSTFNGKLGSLSGAFLLDQTAAQTVINGTPTFNLGITSNDKISINQTQTDVSNQGLNVNVTANTTTNENTLNIANLIGIGNVVYTGKTNSGSSFGVYYENNSLAGFNGTLTNATAIGGGLLMSTAVGASAVITNGNGFSLAMEVDGGTMTNANSLYVNNFNTGGGTVTNYRGFNFGSAFPVTANGQSRYGIYFGSAMPNPGSYTGTTVQAIHLYAGTTSSDGINWGTDTSIYRSAANTLTTGNFIVGGTLLLSNYTTNGFVKFTGSNGTLGVDTNSYEPALGNPTTNGYVLSSTTAGVRSWVASGVPTRGNLTEATSSILTITGGTNAVLGTGTSIQVKQANTTTSGYLSSTDWNTFNGKQAAGAYLTAVTVNAPLTGAGTAASHLSIPVATASANGYLSSTDWTTFNGKQSALTFSTGLTNTAGTVTVSAVQNITRLSNLTTNALVKTTTANGTLAAAVAGDVDSVLPTQTGNSGKYLTTNGTNSSWGTVTTVTIARKHGAVSQTVALGTSALNITHGLGTAPTWVKIAANYNFGSNSFSHSNGEYSGSTYSCVYDGYSQVNNIDTSNIIYLKTAYGATYIIVSATVTLTSTQIQLSFSNTTNSGVTSAIINLQWECGT